jgi:hypothetical protein
MSFKCKRMAISITLKVERHAMKDISYSISSVKLHTLLKLLFKDFFFPLKSASMHLGVK